MGTNGVLAAYHHSATRPRERGDTSVNVVPSALGMEPE